MKKLSTSKSLSPAASRIFERLEPGGVFLWIGAPKPGEMFQIPEDINDDMMKFLNEFLRLVPKTPKKKRKARRR